MDDPAAVAALLRSRLVSTADERAGLALVAATTAAAAAVAGRKRRLADARAQSVKRVRAFAERSADQSDDELVGGVEDAAALCVRGYGATLFECAHPDALLGLERGEGLVVLRATAGGFDPPPDGALTADVLFLGRRVAAVAGAAAEPASESGGLRVDRFDARIALGGAALAAMAQSSPTHHPQQQQQGLQPQPSALERRLDRERYRDLPEHDLFEPPRMPAASHWCDVDAGGRVAHDADARVAHDAVDGADARDYEGGAPPAHSTPALVTFKSHNAQFLVAAAGLLTGSSSAGDDETPAGAAAGDEAGEAGPHSTSGVEHGACTASEEEGPSGGAAGPTDEGEGPAAVAPPPALQLTFERYPLAADIALPASLGEYRVLVAVARRAAFAMAPPTEGGGSLADPACAFLRPDHQLHRLYAALKSRARTCADADWPEPRDLRAAPPGAAAAAAAAPAASGSSSNRPPVPSAISSGSSGGLLGIDYSSGDDDDGDDDDDDVDGSGSVGGQDRSAAAPAAGECTDSAGGDAGDSRQPPPPSVATCPAQSPPGGASALSEAPPGDTALQEVVAGAPLAPSCSAGAATEPPQQQRPTLPAASPTAPLPPSVAALVEALCEEAVRSGPQSVQAVIAQRRAEPAYAFLWPWSPQHAAWLARWDAAAAQHGAEQLQAKVAAAAAIAARIAAAAAAARSSAAAAGACDPPPTPSHTPRPCDAAASSAGGGVPAAPAAAPHASASAAVEGQHNAEAAEAAEEAEAAAAAVASASSPEPPPPGSAPAVDGGAAAAAAAAVPEALPAAAPPPPPPPPLPPRRKQFITCWDAGAAGEEEAAGYARQRQQQQPPPPAAAVAAGPAHATVAAAPALDADAAIDTEEGLVG